MAEDEAPEPGFWRCTCAGEVPETCVYCECGAAHPYSGGDPWALHDDDAAQANLSPSLASQDHPQEKNGK